MTSRGPLVSPRQGFGEGASINRITTILSLPPPHRHPASPPTLTSERLAVATQCVAQHLRVHGDYSFLLPDLAGALRQLRDPHSPDYELDEEDEDDEN